VLGALIHRFGGGPVGLSTLAVAVGEEAETVEVVAEPFLVREGLIARTPRGRVATPAAWQHLGLPVPRQAAWSRYPGAGPEWAGQDTTDGDTDDDGAATLFG
jgi:Holliday junction DNA helicase RuvB